MPRPLGPRSPAAAIPKQDGIIQPGALDQEDVIACSREEHTQKHCGLTMPVDDIVALYDPSRAALAGLLPETAVFEKWVRHEPVIFDTKVTSAQRVIYVGPLFRVHRVDGSCFYEAPLPGSRRFPNVQPRVTRGPLLSNWREGSRAIVLARVARGGFRNRAVAIDRSVLPVKAEG